MAIATSNQSLDLNAAPRTPGDFVFRRSIAICGWCWSNCMVFVGMRWLDFTKRIGLLRSVLGMKAGRLDKAQVGAMAGSEE